ncbi:MAG: hypothetical protein Q9215_006739 [Flavoplaca cf. flavocitrina]
MAAGLANVKILGSNPNLGIIFGFPRWLAPRIEKGSGRQMKVKIGKEDRKDWKSALQIVVGLERHRKSFCTDCPVSYLGLGILTPDDSWQEKVEKDDDDEYGRQFTGWTGLNIHYQKSYWSVEALSLIWQDVFDELMPTHGYTLPAELKPHLAKESWLMPPNTRRFGLVTVPDVHQEYALFI